MTQIRDTVHVVPTPAYRGVRNGYFFNGLAVYLHPGEIKVAIRPKWYDLPRRLGFRDWKSYWQTVVHKGQVFVLSEHKLVIVREDDWATMKKRCQKLATVPRVTH